MKMMEIEAFAARSLRTLSSGEQQKTAIARVLASDAKIILLEEPCANLDMAAALRVLQKLQELRATGHSVLLTLHDLNLAARFADYGLILRGGQLVAAGKDVFNRQHFAAAFDIKAEEALTATGKVSWHFEVDL
jgi:iron complex transport system ATP-binding protein